MKPCFTSNTFIIQHTVTALLIFLPLSFPLPCSYLSFSHLYLFLPLNFFFLTPSLLQQPYLSPLEPFPISSSLFFLFTLPTLPLSQPFSYFLLLPLLDNIISRKQWMALEVHMLRQQHAVCWHMTRLCRPLQAAESESSWASILFTSQAWQAAILHMITTLVTIPACSPLHDFLYYLFGASCIHLSCPVTAITK